MSEISNLSPIAPNPQELLVLRENYELLSKYIRFWMVFHEALCVYIPNRRSHNPKSQVSLDYIYDDPLLLENLRENLDRNRKQLEIIREIVGLPDTIVSIDAGISNELIDEIEDFADKIISLYGFLIKIYTVSWNNLDVFVEDAEKVIMIFISNTIILPNEFLNALANLDYTIHYYNDLQFNPNTINEMEWDLWIIFEENNPKPRHNVEIFSQLPNTKILILRVNSNNNWGMFHFSDLPTQDNVELLSVNNLSDGKNIKSVIQEIKQRI